MIEIIEKKYHHQDNNQPQWKVLIDHPQNVADHLESAWILTHSENVKAGTRRSFPQIAPPGPKAPAVPGIPNSATNADCQVEYHHLIYAYMLENTRMVQIFYKVLQAYRNGEELGTPSPETVLWLRNTEMLFYRHLPGFYTFSLRSEIRPDTEAIRRNAYYRMFGMDLGHGDLQDKPYSFPKPEHANQAFPKIIKQLLVEIYRAVINQSNTSGTNSTDFAAIARLSKELGKMLKERRQNGNLGQEEFNAVIMMSWFKHTLEQGEFPLFKDLGAKAGSPEDRLLKIGQKVKLPANAKSGSFFELAPRLSKWLLLIEDGEFETIPQVEDAMKLQAFRQHMTSIITDWSIATGMDIKRELGKAEVLGVG